MQRGVGKLYAIALVAGVGDVDGVLQGVACAEVEAYVMAQTHLGIECGVEPCGMYTAVVSHLPYIGGGEGYYLVGDVVEIAVCGEGERCECSPLGCLPSKAEIVFAGTLGTEILVATTEVVEVVEGGHAEGVLVHQPQVERNVDQGAERCAKGGGEFFLNSEF